MTVKSGSAARIWEAEAETLPWTRLRVTVQFTRCAEPIDASCRQEINCLSTTNSPVLNAKFGVIRMLPY